MEYMENLTGYVEKQSHLCQDDVYTYFHHSHSGCMRGLRDENGQGVLTGLTNISQIIAFKDVDGQKVPCDGELLYRGYDVQDLVKGFRTNITETCDKENKPNLITDVEVKGATTANNTYVESGVKGTEDMIGNKVDTLYCYGAYQSEDNRKFADKQDIDLITGGLQGKPSRFDLEQTDDTTLEVTDKHTGEVINAILVKNDKWKIAVINKKGKKT